MPKELTDEDFYIDEERNYVFTESYLRKRGSCCKNECKHCPYDFEKK